MSLPPETRPGLVRLQVADLTRSLEYYERVIGLHVRSREVNRASLGAGAHGGVLLELVARQGALPVPRRGSWGLYHFALLLPDRAALGRFVQHALPMRVVSGAADHAVSEAIYLNDPDGLGIEVYADRPRDMWRHTSTGELQMGTESLDVDAVIDAAGESVWDAAPSGTVVGHVHLHVGDLERADAFYHGGVGLDRIVWSYPGALFLSAGGYHHHLGTNTWAAPHPASDDQARLLSWDLELPDRASADAVADRLMGQRYPVEPTDVGWEAKDPWGTVVRIVSRP
jgi:catechol 2,3-dioxygenase